MRRSIVIAALVAAAVSGGAGYVLAEGMPPADRMPGGQMMPGMQHVSPQSGVASPSTTAYRVAMDKMHRDTAITYTGDADKDFAAGMIAHHQGAIEMARIVLDHGEDAEVRKLAHDVIAAQEKEIVQLRAILARLGRS